MDFALDPERSSQERSRQKRSSIVLTNLHNPSSVLTPESTRFAQVGDIARSVNAQVLVDEVYLDAVYDNTPRTSFHLGNNFVVTNSLTKVYGLSGLRCGWILAQPDLARAMYELNDLFAATPVHPTELLSVIAFQHLDKIRNRARHIVEADRAHLQTFLDANKAHLASGPQPLRHDVLSKAAARRRRGFTATLRNQFETTVVPGQFFEMPDHFRIGMGVDSEMFAEGLHRLTRALQ